MSKEGKNNFECFCCHKKLNEYSRWQVDPQDLKSKRVCDKCLIELFIPQELQKKDQRIAELEEQLFIKESKKHILEHKPAYCILAGNDCEYIGRIKQLENNALVLYSALYEILEKEDSENVATRIDHLTKTDNGEICDKYKELRVLKEQLKQANEIINKPDTLIAQQGELIDSLRAQLKAEQKLRKLDNENSKNCYANLQKICDEQIKDLQEKLKRAEVALELTKAVNSLDLDEEKVIKAYRDDFRQVEVVNGVEFNTEQCMIIEQILHNKELQTERKLLYCKKNLVEKIREWCVSIREYTHDENHRVLSIKALNKFLDSLLEGNENAYKT